MPSLQMILTSVSAQIAVVAVILTLSARLIRSSGQSLAAVFLTYLFALWLFTDLYWLIYDLMRPDTRMPFAANEIGEMGIFLSMAAMLTAAVSFRSDTARWQAIGAVAFTACNVALWIAWSGEWIQDIFIGAAFACCLYMVACGLKTRRVLTRGEWIMVGCLCALEVCLQGLTFVFPEHVQTALELAAYLVLLAGTGYWAWKLLMAWTRRAKAKDLMCLAFALTIWCILSKYDSDGRWYYGFLTAETLSLPFVYLSVRKAVTEP